MWPSNLCTLFAKGVSVEWQPPRQCMQMERTNQRDLNGFFFFFFAYPALLELARDFHRFVRDGVGGPHPLVVVLHHVAQTAQLIVKLRHVYVHVNLVEETYRNEKEITLLETIMAFENV